MMEAKNFRSKDDFDMVPFHKGIVRWSTQKQDYDFVKATKKSRMHLGFILPGSIRATGRIAIT